MTCLGFNMVRCYEIFVLFVDIMLNILVNREFSTFQFINKCSGRHYCLAYNLIQVLYLQTYAILYFTNSKI